MYYKETDLVLDTFPYNGGLSSSEALECGVPVVTIRGESFHSRLTSSLLQHIDSRDLICDGWVKYINKSLDIIDMHANGTSMYENYRSRLMSKYRGSSLYINEHWTFWSDLYDSFASSESVGRI